MLQLDTERLPKGIYVVRVEVNGVTFLQEKIIKQ